jgi:hypothetical protein
MAENPLGHEINAATDEEMLSFLAGFYPATNPDKLSVAGRMVVSRRASIDVPAPGGPSRNVFGSQHRHPVQLYDSL